MLRGRPNLQLLVSRDVQEHVLSLRRPKSTYNGLPRRADVVLRSADVFSHRVVSAQLGVGEAKAGKWWPRYISRGLAGLLDEPRCGTPRQLTD